MISTRRRGSRISLYASLFAALVVLVVMILWRAPLSGMFWQVITPVVVFRNSLGSSEVSKLRAELASTTATLADRNELYQENLLLKAELGRNASVRSIVAGVIMRPPGVPYDTLMLDAGSAEGIAVGDLVSAGGTTIIGTVREVYEHNARVVLLSSPGESYQTLIGSTPAALEGQGGGSLSASVPESSTVAVGDSVVGEGIVSSFLGTVSYVKAVDGESFKTVYVELPVNLFSLRYVEVRVPVQ